MEKYQKPIITDKKDAFPETVVTAVAPALVVASKLFGDDVITPARPLSLNKKSSD